MHKYICLYLYMRYICVHTHMTYIYIYMRDERKDGQKEIWPVKTRVNYFTSTRMAIVTKTGKNKC